MHKVAKSPNIPVRKTSPKIIQNNKGDKMAYLNITEPSFDFAPQRGNSDFQFEELFVSESVQFDAKPSLKDSQIISSGDELSQDKIESEEVTNPDIGEGETLELAASKVNLEDFQILKVIGKGAYGKVFQVLQKSTDQIYAMKVLRKDFLIKTKNVTYTKTEKDILRTVRHPYIVSLHYAFQNEGRVYLVMDYMNGGQLFYHMREQSMFSEVVVQFYTAEIVLALSHLHSIGIIHRDLKPENILLDSSGHISLTDFGLAKEFIDGEKANTFCGTPEYMSPEMVQGLGYTTSTDWWSLGILMFDMLTGKPPFRGKNEAQLLEKIVKEKIKFPNYLTSEATSIIRSFLNRNPEKRLGSGPSGTKDIKSNRFFKTINWKKLENRELDAPFRPSITRGAFDISNIDQEFLNQSIALSPVPTLTQSQEKLFQGFSYVRSLDEELDEFIGEEKM